MTSLDLEEAAAHRMEEIFVCQVLQERAKPVTKCLHESPADQLTMRDSHCDAAFGYSQLILRLMHGMEVLTDE